MFKKGPTQDFSGTITSGGTAQYLSGTEGDRDFLLIQNLSAEDLWFNFDKPAVANQPSVLLESKKGIVFGADAGFVPQGKISVIGATTGNAFTVKTG